MVTQVTPLREPLPDSFTQTKDEFNDAFNRFFEDLPAFGAQISSVGVEVSDMGANALAAVAELANAAWVSGATYAIGDVSWSLIDHLSYRRKTAGAGTTDPSNDPTNWALQTATSTGGSDTTSSAVDITLTSTSGRLQVITMTASSKKVTLPAATGLRKGAPVYVIENAGLYRFALHKNGGAFICYVKPGQVVALGCSDNSTSAGVWQVSGQNIESVFDGNDPVVLNGVDSRSIAAAMLTATKAVCAYVNNATGRVNVVVVNFGSASGSPTEINAEASKDVCIAAQTSSQVTVVYKTSSGATKGYVVDISGNTATPGAVATIDASATSNGTALAALSSTQLLCAYHDAGAKERVLDIASSAITPSGEVTADATAADGTAAGTRAEKITASKAIYCFRANSKAIQARLQSISGSTPAPTGSVLQITAPGTITSLDYGVVVVSTTRAIIAQPLDRIYGDLMVTLLDISGLSPVILRNKIFDVGLIASANISAVKLGANDVYVSWTGAASSGVDAMPIKITSDDQLILGQVAERLEPNVTAAAGYMACAALDSTHIMQLSRNASTFLSAKVVEIAA